MSKPINEDEMIEELEQESQNINEQQSNENNLEDIEQENIIEVNEEQDDEDEDSSSNDQDLMPRALPINSESDLDSSHADYEGLQYLLNVRKEANKTSNIMIAKNVNIIETETDAKYIPKSIFQGEFQSDSKLTQWQQDQIIQFKSFKKHLEYLDEQIQKGMKPQEIISNYYIGLEDDKYVKSKKCFLENFMNDDLTKIVIPSTQTLQKISYIRLEKIFEYVDSVIHDKLEIIEQIQSDENNNNTNNINQIYHDKNVFLNYQQYLWIYGLLGKLDNPILADISCILNKILQISVFQQKNFLPNRDDSQMVIAMTSMIIVIIREYYGQKYVSI